MRKSIKLLLIGLLLCYSTQYQEMKSKFIDGYVGREVVKMTNEEGNSGGTGFHVVAPSGKTYILTNAHICDHVGKNGELYVSTDLQRPIPRKILESSPVTDLCLVEPLPNHSGLRVASKEEFNSKLEVLGHPQLLPLTPSLGQLTGTQHIYVMDHVIDPDDKEDKCNLPKNEIKHVNALFFEVDVCTISLDANSSNITILPGNSGSPLISSWGSVEGVAFAGNSSSNWGWFIRLKDIKKFLQPY